MGKNRILALMLCVCALAGMFMPITRMDAQAAKAVRYAWRDDMGNIIVSVTDKKRSSSYAYETIGFTISRCILGTRDISPAHEYVTYAFDSSKISPSVKENGNGTIKTDFVLREGTFLEDVVTYYPDWYADLSSKKTCYIVIDSIMRCIEYDTEGNKLCHGYFYDDGSRTGLVRKNTYWNTIDMSCKHCGGTMPNLMDGFVSSDWAVANEPICAMDHPNRKDGNAASDLISE